LRAYKALYAARPELTAARKNEKADSHDWVLGRGTGTNRPIATEADTRAAGVASLVKGDTVPFLVTFGKFLQLSYHRQHKYTVCASNLPPSRYKRQKKALYNLFAAYFHTVPLEELLESVERARRDAQLRYVVIYGAATLRRRLRNYHNRFI